MANLVLAGGADNLPLIESITANFKWNLDSATLSFLYALNLEGVQKLFGVASPKARR
jgi:hypothetical protein